MTAGTWLQVQGMLRAPWQWRRNDSGPWTTDVTAGLLVLMLGGASAAALAWMPTDTAWKAVGLCAFLGLLLVFCVQLTALLRLDHPHAAQTVPGHPRALRVAALGLWLMGAAVCGAVAAVAAPWLGGDGWRTGLATTLGAATLLCLLGLALRWWWGWIPLCFGPSLVAETAWRGYVIHAWTWAQQHWQAQPLALTLAVLMVQGLALQGVFGQGDAAHARHYASREAQRRLTVEAASGHRPVLAAYGRMGDWLGQPWQRLADAWLAHLCRHPGGTQRSVMARAEFVLHGSQHWVRQSLTVVMACAIMGAGLALSVAFTRLSLGDAVAAGRAVLAFVLAAMSFGALGLHGPLWHSRREQALLMLLPGMPQGAALNRALARQQMWHCLKVWALMIPAVVALVWAGADAMTFACAALALPVSAWLWRDLARLPDPRLNPGWGLKLLCVLAALLSLYLLSRQPGLLLPWALTVLLVSAALFAWRWHRLARWPQALPAGRLA